MSRAAFALALFLTGGLGPLARGAPPENDPPTVLLHYDYMVLPDQGTACAYGTSPGHPWISPDCSVGQACFDHVCRGHTHDPEALAPGAIDMVVAAFAAHGIELKIDKKHAAIPERQTILLHALDASSCQPDAAQRVDLLDLRTQYLQSTNPHEHYAVFGHSVACETCECAIRTGPFIDIATVGTSGYSEIGGLNFVVTLGDFVSTLGGKPNPYIVGGTFMHELGHNLGLHHGGGFGEEPCVFPCEDGPGFKPNYLSVMNYRYQTSGILAGRAVGSSVFDPEDPKQRRLDYSHQVLPTGGNTPGMLWEDGQLDETAGLGSGNADIFDFDDGTCSFQIAATTGPVDWDGDGVPTNPHATADLNVLDHPFAACQVHRAVLRGHDDWSDVLAHLRGNHLTGLARAGEKMTRPEPELTADAAERMHVLYPVRTVQLEITKEEEGRMVVILRGGSDLDVFDVDASSLRFHGAEPRRVVLRDADGDGFLDVVAEFDARATRLHRDAAKARLTGWLWNSQRFIGVAEVGAPARRR